jgi:hypothetical protein
MKRAIEIVPTVMILVKRFLLMLLNASLRE